MHTSLSAAASATAAAAAARDAAASRVRCSCLRTLAFILFTVLGEYAAHATSAPATPGPAPPAPGVFVAVAVAVVDVAAVTRMPTFAHAVGTAGTAVAAGLINVGWSCCYSRPPHVRSYVSSSSM